jgi:uncharacterized membrane protein
VKVHPVIVHFPIAIFTILPIFEIMEIIFRDKFKNSSLFLLIFGLITSIIAVQTGNLDAMELNWNTYGEILELHRGGANYVVWIFAILMMVKLYLSRRRSGLLLIIYFVLLLAGIWFILITAYYGYELVHKFGAGISK